MASTSLSLLVVVLGLLVTVSVAAPPSSSFDGAWTDLGAFGQTAYFCGDATTKRFYGTYSEVGLYVGTLSADGLTASGSWYEAGLGQCSMGSFTFTLAADGSSYSGVYTCSEDNSKDYSVFETRVSSSRPADEKCGVLSTSTLRTLSGHFLNSTDDRYPFDFCSQNNQYVASYEYPINPQVIAPTYARGFEFGVPYESYTVGKGFAQDELGNSYVTLNFRTTGNIVHFWWCGVAQNDHAMPSDFSSSGCHGAAVLASQSYAPILCDRNRGLSYLPSPTEAEGGSSSSASRVAVAALAVAVAVVAAVL